MALLVAAEEEGRGLSVQHHKIGSIDLCVFLSLFVCNHCSPYLLRREIESCSVVRELAAVDGPVVANTEPGTAAERGMRTQKKERERQRGRQQL